MKKNFNARLSTELGGPAKWALMIFALIFVCAADARQPSGDSAADLDGQWYHNGKPTRILVAHDGRRITIINQFDQSKDDYPNRSRNLVIPSMSKSDEVNKKRRRMR